ncbi:MAG: ATP synthase subunit I [Terriglobia bacterium]
MTELPRAEQEFLAGAVRRLGSTILLLVPAGTAVAGWQWGGDMAVAVAFGGGLAYLNYRWIVSIVDTLMAAQKARVPRRTYLKLLAPLILLVILLYAIFSRSLLSPLGVAGGVLLLVPAVVVEAVYEIFLAVRR